MLAVFAASFLFVRAAKRAPMQNKLYKELLFSLSAGFAIGGAYPYYYWRKYLDVVDESYSMVKKKFERYREIFNGDQDQNKGIIKNFGLSQYNDSEIEDDVDVDVANHEGVMDGTEEGYRQEQAKRLLTFLHGS